MCVCVYFCLLPVPNQLISVLSISQWYQFLMSLQSLLYDTQTHNSCVSTYTRVLPSPFYVKDGVTPHLHLAVSCDSTSWIFKSVRREHPHSYGCLVFYYVDFVLFT